MEPWLFEAETKAAGEEPWISNGTPAGTHLVKDINPGPGNGVPPGAIPGHTAAVLNGFAFFPANDGVNGYQLWKGNGTAAGTVLVKNINPGGSSYPYPWQTVGGTVFFSANDGTHGRELWKTNGTAAGTVLVKDINRGSGSSNPYYLANLNNTLFFSADDGTHGQQLWRSDGTATGTVMVRDIFPGQNASSYPQGFTNVNGTAFFTATNGTYPMNVGVGKQRHPNWYGSGPWRPGAVCSSQQISRMLTARFSSRDSSSFKVQALWRTTARAAGTSVVEDIQRAHIRQVPRSTSISRT